MKIENTKIKNINVHFWVLLNIAICAIINDYAVYLTGINYGISLIISTIILVVTNFFIIKKKIITIKSDFEWYDIVFILMVIILAALRIAIPDTTYDTINYHIYLQENIRIDKINFDFFAGKTFNGFLFPLGDRMHYIARYLLGYRLGTIISYYSIIVIFYQFKNVLNHITGKRKLNSFLAILCWTSFILRQWTGFYYIDTFSVAFTLGIIYFLLTEKDCFADKSKIWYLTALTGILTGIKLPNLILIFPVFLIFLIKRRKQLKLKSVPVYLVAAIIFIIPFIIYIIDNIIQTGSPLYPFYNNILKSEYFGNYSWVEPLFGIPNWKYKLIWPIYTSLSKDGYGDRFILTDPIWAIGYVISLLYLIYGAIKWKKRNKELFLISIIAIIMTFLWVQFLYGYMRYGLIIPVLYSLIIGVLINKLAYFIRRKFLSSIEKEMIYVFFALVSIFLVWIFALSIITEVDLKQVANNYKYVFKDRNGITIKIDGVWGVDGDDSALTQILREKDVPIYNLQKQLYSSSEKAKKQHEEILENNKDIYVLINKKMFKIKYLYLYGDGFELEKIRSYTVDEIPYLEASDVLYLYKLKPRYIIKDIQIHYEQKNIE